MIGLVILFVGSIYLALLLWVTRGAYRWAKREGLSKAKCWLVGAAGFLVVYLPVFWDHIPTIALHQYFCATEGGFKVNKTVDQWNSENPGVVDTLVANKDGRAVDGAYVLNQRFNWVVRRTGPQLFNRWRWEQQVVDSKTKEILAKYVDFSTGNGNIGGELPLKFWLQNEHCVGGELNQEAMRSFRDKFKGSEK